jgi:hypothetical protein
VSPFFNLGGYRPPFEPDREPVREFDFVWTFVADSGGQCAGCHQTYLKDDMVHAVGFRDIEVRKTLCGKCYEQATEEAA